MRRIITAREQAEMLAPWRRVSYTDPMGEQDWNEIYPDLPDTVHRGIGITLPDELHRMVHDPSIPVEHRAQALLRHIGTPEARTSPWGHDWREGLGTSWSGDDGVADDFARRMADQHTDHNDKHARENDDHTWGTDEDGDPVGKPGTAVMLHAQLPQLDEIDDDPNGDGSGQRYTYHGHGEQEVPVHQGTAMHIKGISWRPVLSIFHPDYATDPEEYTHHEFGEGNYHQARRRAAVDPTEHGIDPDDYYYRRELGRWKPKVGEDGMVDLYHRTSPKRADSIVARGFDSSLSGTPYSRSTDEIFFTTIPNPAHGNRYGDALVHVRVPVGDVSFDPVWGEDEEEAWATVFPPDLKGLPIRRLAAFETPLSGRTAAASDTSLVYHLTNTPNFLPDPEKRPTEGLYWGRDPEKNPKGLYVTNIPNYWLSWGNRPYVAEFEAPDELLKQFKPTRNYPEHIIPPENFKDLTLKRVLPTPGLLREKGPGNPGGFSDPEYAMGQDFLTGEKFKTRRTPNGSIMPEDRDAIKALWEKNYGSGPYQHPVDARDMTPQEQKKYERWYNRYWNTAWKEDDF